LDAIGYIRGKGLRVRKIKATQRMLTKYLNKNKKALCRSKCTRKLKENELLLVTTNHINYYCISRAWELGRGRLIVVLS
jgi:hypothetical protein